MIHTRTHPTAGPTPRGCRPRGLLQSLEGHGGRLNDALSFAPTGSWSTWKELTVQVFLQPGTNTVRLTSTGSNGPNLDSLTVA